MPLGSVGAAKCLDTCVADVEACGALAEVTRVDLAGNMVCPQQAGADAEDALVGSLAGGRATAQCLDAYAADVELCEAPAEVTAESPAE